MVEYIERGSLVRQIICNMTEFIGAPDDVQKHDEQCNYAINMIEDALIADVAPVVHGRWINAYPDIEPNPLFMYGICSNCGFEQSLSDKLNYCPNCGAKMDGSKE